MHKTSKHAKFEDILLSAFRDMMSQKVLSRRDTKFTPLESSKIREKSLFMPENIFFLAQNDTSLHFPGFQVKQKIHMFKFS